MVQLSHPYKTTGKTIALTVWTFISEEMSLLFNMLFRFVTAFLLRSKCFLISWLQLSPAVILKPKKIKCIKSQSISVGRYRFKVVQFSSVAQSCPTLCDLMDHRRPGFPVHQTPRVYSVSCPLSRWCHPTISFSVIPFSSHLQSFPASGSFQMSQFFALGGQSIGVSASASVLSMNIQDWFPLGWTGWISLQAKGFLSLLQNHS